MQIYVDGPDGHFTPLEGEELERAREALWRSDLISFADKYVDQDLCMEHPAFDEFYRRLSALVWLHRTVDQGVEAISAKHAHSKRTGDHRMSGWAGECDMLLDDEIYLREDLLKINSGALIASCAAALESLASALLDRVEDRSLRRQGLQRKIEAILERWPDVDDPDGIKQEVKWIADRRNAFAHSLLDEVDVSERIRKTWTFDPAAVEEAFVRVGSVAGRLAECWLIESDSAVET
ncbi:hypothetical protein ODJ79_37160 [Actinoplanes sp. KI2]|uniref:hypothetical protein n=1 Tax=Actinoplanes sp. KI2 TaxID=2983315 RepID=UPI0021D59733|nr:hypothetical protein [Actinoplanes sp. KI2]MCU7729378.1 hypothetical protein [Actinoplanes sp. KI2]